MTTDEIRATIQRVSDTYQIPTILLRPESDVEFWADFGRRVDELTKAREDREMNDARKPK